jgi:hypothetical protein
MRSRTRLIEVLDSVNPQAVSWFTKSICTDMALLLRGEFFWQGGVRIWLDTFQSNRDSDHIRELLQEGLAILEADRLTGCKP